MATVLLTWELGDGATHLAGLHGLTRRLVDDGHRVVAAVRDLGAAAHVFRGIDVGVVQAPRRPRSMGPRIAPVRTFAHVLYNNGFSSFDELWVKTSAWRNLYEYIQPDVLLLVHSPTALLAAWGYPARRVLLGTGYFCPPDTRPLPDMLRGDRRTSEQNLRDEEQVLRNVNMAMECCDQEPLPSLSGLYHRQVDDNFLLTFEELDHYAHRDVACYCGPAPNECRAAPFWPDGEGKRVFAHLKPFSALPDLLRCLRDLQCPTLICGDGLAPCLKQQFRSPTLRFADEPLDIDTVAGECELAVLHGDHQTTASMLLAGKPVLQLPVSLEHRLLGEAVARLDAGIAVPVGHGGPTTAEPDVAKALHSLLASGRYANAARRFSHRYASYNADEVTSRMADSIGELLKAGVP
jgi:hypothetical protein